MASAKRAILALVVAALAVGFVATAAQPARAASDSISLYGSALAGWGTSSTSETNPGPTFTVAQGDSVTITLHSTDGAQHEFLLDYSGNGQADSGEPTSSVFTSTTTLTFVANQAGTFTYYCLFHPGSMKGTFIVTSTTGTNPPGSAGVSGGTLAIIGIVIVAVVAVGVGVLVLRRRPRQP